MNSTLANPILLAVAIGVVAVACGGGDDDDKRSLDGNRGGTSSKVTISSGGKATIPTNGTSGTTGGGGTSGSSGNGQGTGNTGPYMLPDGYTPANDGGWMLGDPVTKDNEPDLGSVSTTGCGTTILGIVRDFKRGDQKDGHPDFETFTGSGQVGIVLDDLGDDLKPVYNDNPPATGGNNPGCDHDGQHNVPCTTSADDFNQWYNDKEGVNDPYYIFFSLEPGADGLARFTSKAFFPLDGAGFGNQGASHNFGFTTEVHTTFQYNGGENFTFTGDDDVWVFINKQLAIDLGGLHSSMSKSVSLDTDAKKLGIKKGEVYALDLFHAERHSSESNFNIIANLHFVDCGVIVPSGPVK